MGIEREVREFIGENFITDQDVRRLPGDASLTRSGILDSMGVLELVMFLEERFGITVPDEDTVPENLDTIDNIVAYLHRNPAVVDQGELHAVR